MFRSFFLLFGLTSALIAGCSDDDTAPAPSPSVCAAVPAPVKPAAACDVSIELPPIQAQASLHVAEGTAVTYCSNPPSSGPHYSVWANFQEFDSPVEAPYLVHSLEHGGVVLFYKCEGACPEIIDQLRAIRDAVPIDERCFSPIRARIILVPNPAITTPVAAAAWGATYRAACLDRPSLEAFVRDHYAKGPENICAPGRSF